MVVRFDRGKVALRLILYAGLIALGFYEVVHPGDDGQPTWLILASGWILIIAGFGMIGAYLPRLLGGPALVLDEQGLWAARLWGARRRIDWLDIERFYLAGSGYFTIVKCQLKQPSKWQTAMARLPNGDGVIMPASLTLEPVDLEQRLNEWWAQANPKPF